MWLRQIGITLLGDEVTWEHGPEPAASQIICMTCFRRMCIGSFHERHVETNKRVCQWCMQFERKECRPVSSDPELLQIPEAF
jgi:hypothetical protein